MVNLNLLAPSWWATRPSHSLDDTPVDEVVWLDHDLDLDRGLFAELPHDAVTLAVALKTAPAGYRILRTLARHPQLALTPSDLAYLAGGDEVGVRETLRLLAREGVVDTVRNGQQVCYRLTTNPLGVVRVTDVCAWHDRWQARVARLQRALGLREGA